MKHLLLCDNIFISNEALETVDGYILVDGERIEKVVAGAPDSELLADYTVHDYRGKVITAGLIDAHTHLVHGGSRENELDMKLHGKTYMDIHRAGGGIFSTMRATREASDVELAEKALKSLDIMLRHGTTTVEAKSGYGLDLDNELRVLRLQKVLDEVQPVDIVSTYMGAHATPPEFENDADGYLRFIEENVFPKVREEGLADFADAFCEDGIFSVDQMREHLSEARRQGFELKLHADEIEPMGGAELAAELNCVSAEHLMAISDSGIEAMAESGTVAVVLPATSFFLRSEIYAPAKKMWERGVRVAIATDYNPGSSPTENLQQAMWNACYMMGLTPEQILAGVTINAAYAIKREADIGSIEAGKRADFAIFDAPNIAHIVYHFGINRIHEVWKDGYIVHTAE